MKKLILEIDEEYGDIVTITAIGMKENGTNVTTFAAETKKESSHGYGFIKIKPFPTAKWERGTGNDYYCSNCKAILLSGSMKFCYNCGAEMRGNHNE